MFNGVHMVIYTKDADADRVYLRDVLGLTNVDVGNGWLIFALPPAELACHPSETSDGHELYFMCGDIEAARIELGTKGVETTNTTDEGWGLLSSFMLPGGGSIGFYQPRHERPA